MANNVSFIVCSAPVFTILLALILFRDVRATGRLMLGSVLALVGMAAIIFNGHFVLHLSPRGDLLALVAALCWAVYSILIRSVSRRYSAVFITRKVFAYGLLTILPVFAWHPWQFPLSGLLQTSVWTNLLFLSLVASFACFILWSWAVKEIGALSSSNYIYLNPIATCVASAIILSEPITPIALLGLVLIIAGVYLAEKR
jgi:drug/metabolite transporter (DMT)-like permease